VPKSWGLLPYLTNHRLGCLERSGARSAPWVDPRRRGCARTGVWVGGSTTTRDHRATRCKPRRFERPGGGAGTSQRRQRRHGGYNQAYRAAHLYQRGLGGRKGLSRGFPGRSVVEGHLATLALTMVTTSRRATIRPRPVGGTDRASHRCEQRLRPSHAGHSTPLPPRLRHASASLSARHPQDDEKHGVEQNKQQLISGQWPPPRRCCGELSVAVGGRDRSR